MYWFCYSRSLKKGMKWCFATHVTSVFIKLAMGLPPSHPDPGFAGHAVSWAWAWVISWACEKRFKGFLKYAIFANSSPWYQTHLRSLPKHRRRNESHKIWSHVGSCCLCYLDSRSEHWVCGKDGAHHQNLCNPCTNNPFALTTNQRSHVEVQ